MKVSRAILDCSAAAHSTAPRPEFFPARTTTTTVATPPVNVSTAPAQHQLTELPEHKLKMRGHCSPALKRSWRVVLQDNKTQWPRRYGTVTESLSLTTPPSALDEALAATSLRNNWTKDEIKQIYETPLMKLAYASVSLL